MGWVARTSGTDTVTVTVAVIDIAASAPPPHSAKQKLLCATCVLLAPLCTALPYTLNTGTDTCKSDIQHCNTPLQHSTDRYLRLGKNKIRAQGCCQYLRLLPDMMAALPAWHPAHILLSTHAEGASTVGPAAAAHVHGAGHPKA